MFRVAPNVFLTVWTLATTTASSACAFTSEVCDISAEYCDELPSCPAPDVRDPETKHCYRMLTVDPAPNWLEWELECDHAGGDHAYLTVVSTEAEYDLVVPLILELAPDDPYVWLGGAGDNDSFEGETWLRSYKGEYTFGEGDELLTHPYVAWYKEQAQFVGYDRSNPLRHAVCEVLPNSR